MKRIFLLASLLVLTVLIAGCSSRPKSFTFDQITYTDPRPQSQGFRYQASGGQTLEIQPSAAGTQVQVGGLIYLVSGTVNDMTVKLPDGREVSRTYQGSSSYGGAAFGVEVSSQDWDRVDELRKFAFAGELNAPKPVDLARGLFGVLLIAFGALEAVKPRLAFQLAEGWRYANLEPSELFLAFSRVGGVIFILIGLFLVTGRIQ
jgi:hypothetical protein